MIRIAATSVLFLGFSALAVEPISLHTFAKAGKFGFMDDDGIIRIPPRWDMALDFSEGLAAVAIISGHEIYERGNAGRGCMAKTLKWGFIDSAGNTAIPLRYSEARAFSGGRAAVGLDSKWGFINTEGLWVTRAKYAHVGDFREGLAWVQIAAKRYGNFGYIDNAGKLVIPAELGGADDFHSGMARTLLRVDPNGEAHWALIDHVGRLLVTRKDWVEPLGEGRAAYGPRFGYNGLFGLIGPTGNIITPAIFENIAAFSESLAAVKKNGHWGFIDERGEVVIPISFEEGPDDPCLCHGLWSAEGHPDSTSYIFHEGLAKIRTNGRYGYIDPAGKLIIQARFIKAGMFVRGLASACTEAESPRDQRCGFIDKTGSFVISARFSEAGPFNGALAPVRDPIFGNEVLVNRLGKIIYRRNLPDEPDLTPYGECHFGTLGSAPPRDYSITVSLGSSPAGASVYLIPLWDWQQTHDGRDILSNPDILATYLVPQGRTPLDSIKLKAQVYMAIFDLAAQRKITKLSVAPNGPGRLHVSF